MGGATAPVWPLATVARHPGMVDFASGGPAKPMALWFVTCLGHPDHSYAFQNRSPGFCARSCKFSSKTAPGCPNSTMGRRARSLIEADSLCVCAVGFPRHPAREEHS
jgi:hypothetical protein